MLFSLPTLFIFIFLAGSVASLWAITYYMPSDQAFLFYNKSRLMVVHDRLVKDQVRSAVSMLEGLNNKVGSGELTLAKAKKMGADLLRDMRYGESNEGSFFVNTTDGINVVMPENKAMEDKSSLDESIMGVFYVQNFIMAAQEADGNFVNYWYPKQGETTAQQKRAYVLRFEPFDWVVGSGYYLEDLR